MIFRGWTTYLLGMLLISMKLSAQNVPVPHSPLMETFLDEPVWSSGSPYAHSSIRPLVIDSSFSSKRENYLRTFVFRDSAALHQFSNGHFLSYGKKWFKLTLDPIYHSLARVGSTSGFTAELYGGVRGNLFLGKNFTGHFSLRGGGFRPVTHVQRFMDENGVNPGQGTFNDNGFFRSFFDPSGYISYSPSQHFNVQAGYDKLQFGNGYRSLFLSDNADQFAFLKLDTRFWRIRYVNVFANFKDIRPGAYPNKLGTYHHLSMNIGKRFNFGFFENIIWQGADSTGVRGFEMNYLNPIIFYRPVEFSLNSPDNVLMGFDLRYRIGNNNHIYAQLVLDELLLGEVFSNITRGNDSTAQTGFWGNKQGFQVGVKGWNLFWIKDLYYQFEFNWVRPFTYTHVTVEQNYGHANQPLAHPKGANFLESVNVLRYRKDNWLLEAKFIYANYGLDTSGISFGQDIYRSYLDRQGEYGHSMTQGLNTHLFLTQIRAEYVLNAFWDLRIMAGLTTRTEESAAFRRDEIYVFFGITSDIVRGFDDF